MFNHNFRSIFSRLYRRPLNDTIRSRSASYLLWCWQPPVTTHPQHGTYTLYKRERYYSHSSSRWRIYSHAITLRNSFVLLYEAIVWCLYYNTNWGGFCRITISPRTIPPINNHKFRKYMCNASMCVMCQLHTERGVTFFLLARILLLVFTYIRHPNKGSLLMSFLSLFLV